MAGAARQLETVEAWLEQYARSELGMTDDDDAEDDEPSDSDEPFHYPLAYLFQTWAAYNRHGIMPEAGAFNDQDAAWASDMRRLNTRFNAIHRRLMREKYPEGGSAARKGGLFDEADIVVDDWKGLFS